MQSEERVEEKRFLRRLQQAAREREMDEAILRVSLNVETSFSFIVRAGNSNMAKAHSV